MLRPPESPCHACRRPGSHWTWRDAATQGPRHLIAARCRTSCTDADTRTDMLLGEPKSAICVQRFDDSLSSAIHTTYRSWLRSSSMHEPRDPPLKVVSLFFCSQPPSVSKHVSKRNGAGPVLTGRAIPRDKTTQVLAGHKVIKSVEGQAG